MRRKPTRMHIVASAVASFATAAVAKAPTLAPILAPSGFDVAALLPPPPRPDEPLGRSELDALRRIEATRSPDDLARARADDATKSVAAFASAMGPRFDLARLPETRSLFEEVRSEEKAVADAAKAHFRRKRPWIVDPALHPCFTDDAPLSSYPSGHATMGFAMGSVLARIAPAEASAVMARAADYAHSRLVCSMHFPADVAAGQTLGVLIADRLMADAGFAAHAARAAEELRRHGL